MGTIKVNIKKQVGQYDQKKINIFNYDNKIADWIDQWFHSITINSSNDIKKAGWELDHRLLKSIIFVESKDLIKQSFNDGFASPDTISKFIKKENKYGYYLIDSKLAKSFDNNFIFKDKWTNIEYSTNVLINIFINKKLYLNSEEPRKINKKIDEYVLVAYKFGNKIASNFLKNDSYEMAKSFQSGWVGEVYKNLTRFS